MILHLLFLQVREIRRRSIGLLLSQGAPPRASVPPRGHRLPQVQLSGLQTPEAEEAPPAPLSWLWSALGHHECSPDFSAFLPPP